MAEYVERRRVSNACYEIYEETVRAGKHMTAAEVKHLLLRFEKAINSIPAADVAPVVYGRWFDTGVENVTGNIYFCSVCNKYHNPNKKDVKMKRAKEKPDYCPNCGAKMSD